MTNVVWGLPSSASLWTGGLNYFLNLATAIFAQPDRKLNIYILRSSAGFPAPLSNLPIVPYACPAKYSLKWCLKKTHQVILGNEKELISVFQKHGIDVFSHGWTLGMNSPVPTVTWVPDFQHRRLPQMFTRKEIVARDNFIGRFARESHSVLLSSEDARRDYQEFFPEYAHKARVLRFVSMVKASSELPQASAVLNEYGINESYFHLPNQLWKHKNHMVVVEALNILKQHGKCPLVICTGSTEDYRNPTYFGQVKGKVAEYGLEGRIRFLGLVPLDHVSIFMRNALSMINPSLFEGWSTTVEEAKSLGKRLILSNIAVHREQAPIQGIYFEPDSPEMLAEHLLAVQNEYTPDVEEQARQHAEQEFPARQRLFALDYEKIVLNALK